MVSPTKTIDVPVTTTADRNANLSGAPDGTLIYNSDTTTLQYTTNGGSSWQDLAAGSGTFSLQDAYDNGPTINMDSNVDLQVFSSTGELGFSVTEGGATTGIECNRAIQINYSGIGGPVVNFNHPVPTAPGNFVASIGGQTQASNGLSKSYETLQVQVVNDTDAAYECETIHKNIINNVNIECFATGIENKSFFPNILY